MDKKAAKPIQKCSREEIQERFEKKLGEMDHECIICGETINGKEDFEDILSIREFCISGMGQECQDQVFIGR